MSRTFTFFFFPSLPFSFFYSSFTLHLSRSAARLEICAVEGSAFEGKGRSLLERRSALRICTSGSRQSVCHGTSRTPAIYFAYLRPYTRNSICSAHTLPRSSFGDPLPATEPFIQDRTSTSPYPIRTQDSHGRASPLVISTSCGALRPI